MPVLNALRSNPLSVALIQGRLQSFVAGRFSGLPAGHFALALIALAILCTTLWAYAQVHIWYIDSVEYIQDPKHWISTEGRWLNYLLFPVLKVLNGRIALFLDLFCLFLFAFIAARRYVGHGCTGGFAYPFAFAALCVEAPPLVHQLTWPLVILPAAALLSVAALVVRVLPLYAFYILFGTLLAGSIQHLYYLLPLLHLPLLNGSDPRTNIRVLTTRIVPAWAGGFVAGHLLLLAIVYGYTFLTTGTGRAGLQIDDWRRPLPAGSFSDLMVNISRSIEYLTNHLQSLFLWIDYLPDHPILLLLYGTGIACIALVVLGERRHLPAKLLFTGIALAHFVAIIPLGIGVWFRTCVPLAFGVAALLFLTPQARHWKLVLQTTLLLVLSVGWSVQSINTLSYRAGITNTFHDELLRAVPMDPKLFAGIVLLNESFSVSASTSAIAKKLDLSDRNTAVGSDLDISGSVASIVWASVAHAAGFNHVFPCGHERYTSWDICREVIARLPSIKENSGTSDAKSGLYTVLGVHRGYLIVSINPIP